MPESFCTVHLPDEFECPDRALLKRTVIRVLSGDLSFHDQIRRALSEAGFRVGKVQKHWFHDVFEINMRRSDTVLHDTENQLRRKIRRALTSEHIDFDKSTFVLSVQGQRLICAFCFRLGAEGTI